MTDPIRWGLLATGGISSLFARDLGLLPDAEVVAVGSRNQASADRFGAEFGIPGGTAVTPTSSPTRTWTRSTSRRRTPAITAATLLACSDQGKAVLVEKPFAMNG